MSTNNNEQSDSSSMESTSSSTVDNRFGLSDYEAQYSYAWLEFVKQNGLMLRFVPHKSVIICIEALSQNPAAITYVPTAFVPAGISADEGLTILCKLFIYNDAGALRKLPPQIISEELCVYAVRLRRLALNDVPREYKKERVYRAALGKNILDIALDGDDKETTVQNFYFSAVKENGLTLAYIPVEYRIYDLCLIAVVGNGLALEHVPNQQDNEYTERLCYLAVLSDPLALQFVKYKNYRICLAAVKKSCLAIHFIPEEFQTEEICLAAVEKCATMLEFVKPRRRTEKVCYAAVKKCGFVLRFVENQTPEICYAAVVNYGPAISLVDDQTEELCLIAVKNFGYALEGVRNKTHIVCLTAVKHYARAIHSVPEDIMDEEICLAYIDHYKGNIFALPIKYHKYLKTVPSLLIECIPKEDELDTCCVCYDKCMTVIACKHRVCSECVACIRSKTCPLCRRPLTLMMVPRN